MGVGVGRAASSSHVLDRGTGVSPNLPYFCIYCSLGWASVMVLTWELGRGLGSRIWDMGLG